MHNYVVVTRNININILPLNQLDPQPTNTEQNVKFAEEYDGENR